MKEKISKWKPEGRNKDPLDFENEPLHIAIQIEYLARLGESATFDLAEGVEEFTTFQAKEKLQQVSALFETLAQLAHNLHSAIEKTELEQKKEKVLIEGGKGGKHGDGSDGQRIG